MARETEIIEMVDLEGQDHGPSSSSVGDNDDDFIVYSKEDNATVAMECTEEVFLAKIIHGDGAKVIKVVNATRVDDEDDIAKFKDYKPSQLGDSKEVKVPSDPSPPTPPKKEDTEPVSSAEPKKPKVANAPQSGARIFASPLARKLANDHNVPLSKIKGTSSDGTIVQADIEDYLGCKANSIHYKKLQSERRISVNDLVIKDADKKGLSKIADEVKSFTQKAKENSLKPEDYEQAEKRVVHSAGPDQYTFASYMSVTLSRDHRVIDGA
ncbi:hypothetical protein Sjap_017938 [Stephania japonica]|uniref:Peripheral subunit-binding (PSBD) domain-containing protein n=1 Tax=Stephania japonica TaxID=461633 RepID=A0AAP0I788_9MAGN